MNFRHYLNVNFIPVNNKHPSGYVKFASGYIRYQRKYTFVLSQQTFLEYQIYFS